MGPQVGDVAPDFSSTDENGEEIKLSDFKGKRVVLYFYPQDDTPTCTKEACNLRDNYDLLRSKGYVVLGVSPDTGKSHLKFIKKHKLPFPLIADIDHAMISAYGVWGEKTTFGKTYMGLLRTTFLIDEQGKVMERIDKVNSANHTNQILGITE